eukprot:2113935-Prymnesium_polylepis.2
MELFTFLFMGGDLGRIIFLPIGELGGSSRATSSIRSVSEKKERNVNALGRMARRCNGKGRMGSTFIIASIAADPKMQRVLEAFETFNVANAQCSGGNDRQRLLRVIESGAGSFEAFNAMVRGTFRLTGAPIGDACPTSEDTGPTGGPLRAARSRTHIRVTGAAVRARGMAGKIVDRGKFHAPACFPVHEPDSRARTQGLGPGAPRHAS